MEEAAMCAHGPTTVGTLTLAPSGDGVRTPLLDGVARRARTHTKSRATDDARAAVGLNREPARSTSQTHNTARLFQAGSRC